MRARSTALTHVFTGGSHRPVCMSRRSQRDAREASSLGRRFCRTRVVLSPTALGFIPRKPLAPPHPGGPRINGPGVVPTGGAGAMPSGGGAQRGASGDVGGQLVSASARTSRGAAGRRPQRGSGCTGASGRRSRAPPRGSGRARSGPGFPERGSCGHEDRRGVRPGRVLHRPAGAR